MQGTMSGARRRGRPRTAWTDIKTWTGLPVEESVRMTEERDKWGKCVSASMVWPTLGSKTAKEKKLITGFDDRYGVVKFSNRQIKTKFQTEVPVFCRYLIPEFPYSTV